jgi:hypothetical protein
MPVEHQGKVWRQALDKRERPRDMLNYENTQLLPLIGARKKDIQEELEIDLNEEKETENTAELFKELRIKRRTSASETTIERRVSRQDRTAIMSQEVRRLSREEAPGRGGKVGARRQQLGHLLLQQ